MKQLANTTDTLFCENLQRWRHLLSELRTLPPGTPFEARFHVLRLNFPIEALESENPSADLGDYPYCVFLNHRGLRCLPLREYEIAIAEKIKTHAAMSADEKSAALLLLAKLAV